jgi:hypothetical protein
MRTIDIADAEWHVAPEDQGQTVEYAYASVEGGYVRRRTDNSAQPDDEDYAPTYAWLSWDEVEVVAFEPWNGLIPIGTWQACSVTS